MILPRGRRRRQDVGASSVPAAAADGGAHATLADRMLDADDARELLPRLAPLSLSRLLI